MVRQGNDIRDNDIQVNKIRCYEVESSQESFDLSTDFQGRNV